MSQVSRPVQILLLATLLFAAAWFTVLRPKPADGGEAAAAAAPAAQTTPAAASGAAPGVDGLKRAVDEAHGAVGAANGDGGGRAAAGRADGAATGADAGGATGADAGGATGGTGSATDGGNATARRGQRGSGDAGTRRGARDVPARHTQQRRPGDAQVRAVTAALRRHEAVAIAFVDPRTADARAVAREMRHVSRFDGRAVVVAVPLARLSAYRFITNEVAVTVAPTVVIVDPRRRASTIVGYADRGEIEQRLADALAAGRRR